MLDIKDVRLHLVRPVLQRCGLWSAAAENLMIGTALVESGFKFLVQHPGPALSLWQIEPATFHWLISRLSTDRDLMLRVLRILEMGTLPSDPKQLVYNLSLACIIARLKYWYNPTPLPNADDINALAQYWGKIYQTKSKPDSIKRFINLYERYGEHHTN